MLVREMIFASRKALKSSGFSANSTLAKLYEALIFFVTFFSLEKKVNTIFNFYQVNHILSFFQKNI